MKKIGAVSLILIVTLCSCPSLPFQPRGFTAVGSSLAAFEYRRERIADIGTVYHYLKSNLDGSSAASIDFYIAAPDRTESFKIYPGAKARGNTDLIIAEYDWEAGSLETLTAHFVYPDGRRVRNAVFTHQADNRYSLAIAGQNYDLAVGHLPSFMYNFDLADFNFFFRHLADNRAPLSIGIIGLTSGLRFVYSGTVRVVFSAAESRNGSPGLKYEIGGEAFNGESGAIWVNREGLYFEEIAIGLPNNPSYGSFRFRLTGKTEKVSPDEWDALVLSKTGEVTD